MSDLSLNNVLTLKEVAAYLRLPEEKVEKQVRRGSIFFTEPKSFYLRFR